VRNAMEESDHALLRRYRRGDAGALEVLVGRYKRPLFGYILNMTEGRDDAEEIFQEVWFRVIRRFRLFRERNFFGWLIRIAHNLVIDRARRRKPDLSLDVEDEAGRTPKDALEAGGPPPSGRLVEGELGARIRRAVATLPPEQRAVFLMRVEAELPFKEIAKVQKTSINTVLARMHYALGKLRPLLQDEYEALARTTGAGDRP
jgi:RNA polymerase sigma-70 factor, ECF subfamily